MLPGNVTRKDLAKIKPQPNPRAGSRWIGLPHIKMADEIRHQIEEEGTGNYVVRESFVLSKDKQTMNGWLVMNARGTPDGVYSACIGFSNSNKGGMKMYYGVESTNQIGIVIGGGRATFCEHEISVEHQLEAVRHSYWKFRHMRNATDGCNAWISKMRTGQFTMEDIAVVFKRATYLPTNYKMPWSRLGEVFERATCWYGKGAGNRKFRVSPWSVMEAFADVCRKDPGHRQLDEMAHFTEILQTV